MLSNILKTVAPIVGGIIGGPGGSTLAKKVSDILLPGKKHPSESELESALNHATPEQLADIRKLEIETQVKLYDLEVKDREGARKMRIKTGDQTVRNIMYIFSAAFIAMLFVPYIAPKIQYATPEMTDTLRDIMMGLFGFFVGRSREK